MPLSTGVLQQTAKLPPPAPSNFTVSSTVWDSVNIAYNQNKEKSRRCMDTCNTHKDMLYITENVVELIDCTFHLGHLQQTESNYHENMNK